MTKAATLAAVGSVLTPDSSGNVSISGKKYQVSGVATNALAWGNFNCTPTTPTIRSSFNISSITRLGTGSFRMTFTTALSDSNYSIVFGSSSTTADAYWPSVYILNSSGSNAPTTTTFVLNTGNVSVGSLDFWELNVAIFGN